MMPLWSLFVVVFLTSFIVECLFAQARRKEKALREEMTVLQVSRAGLQMLYDEAAKQRDFYRSENRAMHQQLAKQKEGKWYGPRETS